MLYCPVKQNKTKSQAVLPIFLWYSNIEKKSLPTFLVQYCGISGMWWIYPFFSTSFIIILYIVNVSKRMSLGLSLRMKMFNYNFINISGFYLYCLLWFFFLKLCFYMTSHWKGVFQYSFQAVSQHVCKNKKQFFCLWIWKTKCITRLVVDLGF